MAIGSEGVGAPSAESLHPDSPRDTELDKAPRVLRLQAHSVFPAGGKSSVAEHSSPTVDPELRHCLP